MQDPNYAEQQQYAGEGDGRLRWNKKTSRWEWAYIIVFAGIFCAIYFGLSSLSIFIGFGDLFFGIHL